MHTIHVVHVGVMGNVHYKEILDWLLGWFGVDISKDDTESLAEREREVQPKAPQKGQSNAEREVKPKAPQKGQSKQSPKVRPGRVRIRAFTS